MPESPAELVLYESDSGVATLTLNRPERLNTITPELIQQLLAQLDQAQADPQVRHPVARRWPRFLRWL